MSLKSAVLTKLRESGGYVSGEELADAFSKSRTAVWKAINSLRRDGYDIEAHTNKGYILNESDLLSGQEIARCMRNKIKIYYYPSVDSTNNEAKRLASCGGGSAVLIAAGEQTQGRGRQGKSFYSPAGTGVYMSLVTHPGVSLNSAVSATTAAAVAVCRAIERLTGERAQIKWVNDVYMHGEKICGILTEAVSDFESGTVQSVIIGVGINITTSAFPAGVENAGSIGKKINRARLIGAVADELIEATAGEYGDFIDYYRSRSMILGHSIRYCENGEWKNGEALEIDSSGGLVIRDENGGLRTLRSGEISVRRAQ